MGDGQALHRVPGNCPVTPKAIYVTEVEQTVRDGVLTVKRSTATSVEFDSVALAPWESLRRVIISANRRKTADDERRKIVESTANTVTIDAAKPWASAPEPDSRIEIQVRLLQPSVDPKLCIGCGICEHECPVSGLRAIRVTADNESRNRKHALLL